MGGLIIRQFVMDDYERVLALWSEAATGVPLRPSDTPD